jgi:predicted kinase
MRIIFIIGPSFSGKSIYIKENFPDAKIVKISTFNKVVEAAYTNEEIEELAKNAQFYCAEALKNTIRSCKEDDIVILEHQLLKRQSREYYLSQVKEITDTPVECILMDPDEKMIEQMLDFEHTFIRLHQYEKSKLELPSEEEGFASVTAAHPVFNKDAFKR